MHAQATQLGVLSGFGFTAVYALTGLVAGSVADAVHRPQLIAAGMCLWSALTALSGLARSFVGLLLPRLSTSHTQTPAEASARLGLGPPCPYLAQGPRRRRVASGFSQQPRPLSACPYIPITS